MSAPFSASAGDLLQIRSRRDAAPLNVPGLFCMPGRRLGCKVALCRPHLICPPATSWPPPLEGVCKQGQGFGKRTLLGAGRSHRRSPERPGLPAAALHCRDKKGEAAGSWARARSLSSATKSRLRRELALKQASRLLQGAGVAQQPAAWLLPDCHGGAGLSLLCLYGCFSLV